MSISILVLTIVYNVPVYYVQLKTALLSLAAEETNSRSAEETLQMARAKQILTDHHMQTLKNQEIAWMSEAQFRETYKVLIERGVLKFPGE